jgi:hypothetical protein
MTDYDQFSADLARRREKYNREREEIERATAWMRPVGLFLLKPWVMIPLILLWMIGAGVLGYAIASAPERAPIVVKCP